MMGFVIHSAMSQLGSYNDESQSWARVISTENMDRHMTFSPSSEDTFLCPVRVPSSASQTANTAGIQFVSRQTSFADRTSPSRSSPLPSVSKKSSMTSVHLPNEMFPGEAGWTPGKQRVQDFLSPMGLITGGRAIQSVTDGQMTDAFDADIFTELMREPLERQPKVSSRKSSSHSRNKSSDSQSNSMNDHYFSAEEGGDEDDSDTETLVSAKTDLKSSGTENYKSATSAPYYSAKNGKSGTIGTSSDLYVTARTHFPTHSSSVLSDDTFKSLNSISTLEVQSPENGPSASRSQQSLRSIYSAPSEDRMDQEMMIGLERNLSLSSASFKSALSSENEDEEDDITLMKSNAVTPISGHHLRASPRRSSSRLTQLTSDSFRNIRIANNRRHKSGHPDIKIRRDFVPGKVFDEMIESDEEDSDQDSDQRQSSFKRRSKSSDEDSGNKRDKKTIRTRFEYKSGKETILMKIESEIDLKISPLSYDCLRNMIDSLTDTFSQVHPLSTLVTKCQVSIETRNAVKREKMDLRLEQLMKSKVEREKDIPQDICCLWIHEDAIQRDPVEAIRCSQLFWLQSPIRHDPV